MKRWINILLNLFLALVVLIAFWLFSQVFLLASFRIPSDSMEPELVEGDFVAVWKPTLGARLFDLNATLREQTEIPRKCRLRIPPTKTIASPKTKAEKLFQIGVLAWVSADVTRAKKG